MPDSSRTIRVAISNRLAWFKDSADPDFWHRLWKQLFEDFKPKYATYEKGYLDKYEGVFKKWLPHKGKILEAGCGLSQYVIALQARGYEVEGIDFEEKTIEMVRGLYPNLPIRHQDARKIDVPDNYYSGYISLGVIEHTQEGPEAFIAEASRVIRPGGRAVVVVPWFNPFRQIKASLGMYSGNYEKGSFYQYALSSEELEHLLQKHGFTIRERTYPSAFKGLKDEFPLLKRLLAYPKMGMRTADLLNKAITRFPIISRKASHTILLVAEKAY